MAHLSGITGAGPNGAKAMMATLWHNGGATTQLKTTKMP